MSCFGSEQVRPFSYLLTEPDSPFQVVARRNGDSFVYEVNDPEWKSLETLLGGDAPRLKPRAAEPSSLWASVLGYRPNEAIEFVEAEGQLVPRDLFTCWPENVAWEYENWARERCWYEEWLNLAESLTEALPVPKNWNEDRPDEKALRSLEYEIGLSIPERVNLLKRMYALGLLQDIDLSRELETAGCPRLGKWHRASRQLRWVGRFVDGMLPTDNILASPVGLEWFVDGPFLQKFLDPLHHLKFAVHHHIKRSPPVGSSSFVVSMGGRISGAFYYQLGPGGVPQLVRGGEPPEGSSGRDVYPYQKSRAGDRICEMAARAIRAGYPRWGGRLAQAWLEEEPEHGQSWVEVGVALSRLGLTGEAKGCLERARACGHDFSVSGELAPIWEQEASEIPTKHDAFSGWEDDLALLSEEETTALALCPEVTGRDPFDEAFRRLAQKKQFLNFF